MTARLLVYTRTTDYRHDSIPDAIAAVSGLGEFVVDHTEDPAALEAALDGYAAVVFLSTSGAVLTPAGRERLAGYVEAGAVSPGSMRRPAPSTTGRTSANSSAPASPAIPSTSRARW